MLDVEDHWRDVVAGRRIGLAGRAERHGAGSPVLTFTIGQIGIHQLQRMSVVVVRSNPLPAVDGRHAVEVGNPPPPVP